MLKCQKMFIESKNICQQKNIIIFIILTAIALSFESNYFFFNLAYVTYMGYIEKLPERFKGLESRITSPWWGWKIYKIRYGCFHYCQYSIHNNKQLFVLENQTKKLKKVISLKKL